MEEIGTGFDSRRAREEMLQKDRRTGMFVATCEKCHVTFTSTAADLDAAAAELKASKWYEAARPGGRKKAVWYCATCTPQGSGGMGAVSRPNG